MNCDNTVKGIVAKLSLYLRSFNEIEKIIGPEKDFRSMFKSLWNLNCIHDYIQIPEAIESKSDATAEKLRKLGNECFNKKKLIEALEFYNKSILHSKQPEIKDLSDFDSVYNDSNNFLSADVEKKFDFKNLALGYANRSAVLFHMNNYEGCLLDISRAFYYGYPLSSKSKLIERQAKCYIALNKNENAIEILNKYLGCTDKASNDDTKEKEIINLLKKCEAGEKIKFFKENSKKYENMFNIKIPQTPKLEKVNKEIPALSEAVSLGYSSEKGRYLYANRDIMPGELLIKEEPFCASLDPKYFLKFCSNCFVRTFTPVPCPFCSNVIYCCEDCLHKGLNGVHHSECSSVLSQFLALNFGKRELFVLRLIMKIPLHELKLKIRDLENGEKDPMRQGFNKHNIYGSDDYATIYNLVNNKDKQNPNILAISALDAVYIIKLLLKTEYFDNKLNIGDVKKDIELVGATVFKTILTSIVNCFEIIEPTLHTSMGVAVKKPVPVGIGICAALSLVNHSCYPNAWFVRKRNVMICYTSSFIPKGDEILVCYKKQYYENDRQTRVFELKHYCFHCSCIACKENWPLASELPRDIRFRCSRCSSAILFGSLHCSLCKTSTSKIKVCTPNGRMEKEFSNLKSLFVSLCESLLTISALEQKNDTGLWSVHDYERIKRCVYILSKYSILPSYMLHLALSAFNYNILMNDLML